MAVGSSMLATIRTAPPQWAQVLISMPTKIARSDLEQPQAGPKGGGQDARSSTRLRRCAQFIARRFCSGLRGSSFALTSTGAASVAGRLPRPDGVNCARRAAFAA